MMPHDDNHVPSPDPSQPLIPSGVGPGDALVARQPNRLPTGLGVPTGGMSQTPDVLSGGMDKSSLYHSLRRRWILAVGMGLVVAACSAVAMWFMFPTSSTAAALFHVASNTPNLVFEDFDFNETGNYETFQKTQLTLLKSNFVLSAAVRDPRIANLNLFSGVKDRVRWLGREVTAYFPHESEVLQITMSGDEDPEELRMVVDAVAKAYENEVLSKDRRERLRTRDVLATNFNKLREDVNTKMEDAHLLAIELGASAAFERDAESELLSREISKLQQQRGDLEKDLLEYQIQFAVLKQQLEDPQLIEAQIDAAMRRDPQMAALDADLSAIDLELFAQRSASRGAGSKSVKRLERRRENLRRQYDEIRAQRKRQMMAQQRRSPNYALQRVTQEANLRFGYLTSRLATIRDEIDEKVKELKAKGEKSVELDLKRAELDQLQSVLNDMALKLEGWDIEMLAPERITLLQEATSMPGIDSVQRYAIAGAGGIAGFVLTCFAVAYLEFRHRRLNATNQVDEGLGIRVVGTLPSLATRGILDPTHPIIAQLTDSIDNVRTLLMHDSTSKARQVVLVTSAATGEGRTTVASQLAASLARAGRRTLLVDGDVRHPALQDLFEVPLEDGVCEVLRAEVDVADVIRPTHAEGLWLLTAGYCDVDAIHALATDQMQPVFEQLRGEYDFIIVDGPPVLGMSDALLFGQYCDGAIMSLRRDHSQVPKIYQAAELLRGVGIRLFGSVVNGVPTKSDQRVLRLRLTPPKSEREQIQAN